MSDLVGQQWGNYRLTRLLGQGGFAEVYQGQHIRLNMFAAIKILHTHLSEARHFHALFENYTHGEPRSSRRLSVRTERKNNMIDILFLVTAVLLVLSGYRNGAVFSLIMVPSVPLGITLASTVGPRFTALLAVYWPPAAPFIAYNVLFFGTVMVFSLIATVVQRFVRKLPVAVNRGDAILGGVIGIAEAWLMWVFLLTSLGTFLGGIQPGIHVIPGMNIQLVQLQTWHDFYNYNVTNSLFAHVNGAFVKPLPNIPRLAR